jgi:cyclohexyl-isocyanide hydratase
LAWIRQQAEGACSIFSVCTGALICGAAGLLKGRRATTHWASFHLLPYFGAIPVNERVVVDGAWVFAAGVTAGIDGALRLAAELRGDEAAQAIQLDMVYAPEPPFNSGTPETAPAAILEQARQSVRNLTMRREETARRMATKLGVSIPAAHNQGMASPAQAGLARTEGRIGAPANSRAPKLLITGSVKASAATISRQHQQG